VDRFNVYLKEEISQNLNLILSGCGTTDDIGVEIAIKRDTWCGICGPVYFNDPTRVSAAFSFGRRYKATKENLQCIQEKLLDHIRKDNESKSNYL